nr:hypothetical protein [Tanacetum cinerariifolium]
MRGDARQEHSVERDDDVLEETVSRNISEVVVEKTKKKRKKKVAGDASGSTFPPKRLREDYHVITSNIEGKSLAAICGLVPDGSSVSSEVTEPPAVVPSPAVDVPVTTVTVTTTVTTDASAVLPPKVRIKSKNLEIFGDSASAGKANVNDAGHLAPPALFSKLRAMDYDQLYIEFNVGAIRQVVLRWRLLNLPPSYPASDFT